MYVIKANIKNSLIALFLESIDIGFSNFSPLVSNISKGQLINWLTTLLYTKYYTAELMYA